MVLTGHVGNWEMMPIISAMTGHTAHVLYRPLDYEPLERFFAQNRTRFGAKLISKDRALLRVFKALKRQESVVMLLDQNVGWHKGVFVDFFGRRTCTSYGLAFIALKTDAPVVPVFVVRNADGAGFTAEIGPEIPLIKTGDHQKDLEENTQRYNDAIEAVIRRHPDQWFWVHRRWKTRPYTRGRERTIPNDSLDAHHRQPATGRCRTILHAFRARHRQTRAERTGRQPAGLPGQHGDQRTVPQQTIPMRNGWDLLSVLKIRRLIRNTGPLIVQTYMGRATRLTRLPRDSAAIHVARLGGYFKIKGYYQHAHAWVGNTRGICDT